VKLTSPLTDSQLLQQFDDGSLSEFAHRDHVRVAWLYVQRYGMPGALTAFSDALRRFAAAKGAHNLFHVTITWAYLLLIAERQAGSHAASWPLFAEQNPDLLAWKPSILDRYYTADVLWSERARRTFLLPNRGLEN
jgi:hypothetical protein